MPLTGHKTRRTTAIKVGGERDDPPRVSRLENPRRGPVEGHYSLPGAASRTEPVPPGTSAEEGLDYPAGRWELARYGCAGAAALGLILAAFPKGR